MDLGHELVRPLRLAVRLLAGAVVLSAFVADCFVEALQPTMASLRISEEFAGPVIVAIAGSAVENVVGVRLAQRNRIDLGLSVIQNSRFHVALALIPAIVIASEFISPEPMALVLSPLLVAALGLGRPWRARRDRGRMELARGPGPSRPVRHHRRECLVGPADPDLDEAPALPASRSAQHEPGGSHGSDRDLGADHYRDVALR